MELRLMIWEHHKWQEGFPVGKGKFLCPYCGAEVRLPRPWGVSVLKREIIEYKRHGLAKVGNTLHNCPECGMPVLKPRWKEKVNDTEGASRAGSEVC